MAHTRSHWKHSVMGFYEETGNDDYKTGVWADCPLLAIEADPSLAYVMFEDFVDFVTPANADPPTLAGWTCSQDGTEGGLSVTTGRGGLLAVDSECTTQHRGLEVQQTVAHFKLAANKDLWFEARVKVVDTYSTVETFVGLATIDTALLGSGDLNTASDYVGFGVETTAAGVNSFYICKDTVELSDSMSAAGTFAEGTWIRLGFHIDGTTGIHAFVDGAPIALTNVVYTGVPTTDALTISFVCQGDHTNDSIMTVDWVRCVQLR